MRQAFGSHKELGMGRVSRAAGSVLENLEMRQLLSVAALPGLFVENQGQFGDTGVRYAYRGNGLNVGLTDTGAAYQFYNDTGAMQFGTTLVGANAAAPAATGSAAARFNYFVGDQSAWHANVPGYSTVEYAGIYNGVDLYNYAKDGQLKYEFHVAAGASYGQIAVQYNGIQGLSLAADGALMIDLGGQWGVVRDDSPYIYQMVNGAKQQVAGKFVLLGDNTYGFAVTGAYDPSKELVIDPVVQWASYVGYRQAETASGVAVDSTGASLVTGVTYSLGWFEESLFNAGVPPKPGTTDGFVAKYSEDGMFVWGTYVGWGGEDTCNAIAVDSTDDSAYVVGTSDGGTTFGPNAGKLEVYRGGTDALVWKVTAQGQLAWANLIGGANDEQGLGIAVSGATVVVTGSTSSPDVPLPEVNAMNWIWPYGKPAKFGDPFPTDDDPRLSATYAGGATDAFGAGLKTADGVIAWSGYFGTGGDDAGTCAAASGEYVVLGANKTNGSNTDGMYQIVSGSRGVNGGLVDLSSTYYTSGETRVTAIGLDQYNNVNLAGTTTIDNFWNSTATNSATKDAFVLEMVTAIGKWGVTISGGDADILLNAIAVQPDGSVLIGGQTSADGFKLLKFDYLSAGDSQPIIRDVAFVNTPAGVNDGYVVKLGYGGSPLWGEFIGGALEDSVTGIGLSSSNQTVSVVGTTVSDSFSGISFDNTLSGPQDAFLVAISQDSTAPGFSAILPTVSQGNVSRMSPYDFTVTYHSDSGLNLASIQNSTVRISHGGVSLGSAVFKSADVSGDAPTITATYEFTPPGGTWVGRDGVYQANLVGGRVMNVDGFAIGETGSSVSLGSITVNTIAPTVQIKAGGINLSTVGDYVFTVVYNGGLTAITQYPITLALSGGGTSLPATVVGTPSVAGNATTVTYSVAKPAKGWKHGVTYTLVVPAGSVSNAGNFNAEARTNVYADLQAPTASITSGSITASARTFKVTYNGTYSPLAVVPTTLILSKSGSADLTASLVGTLPTTLGTSYTATYTVQGPGSGKYTITVGAGTVKDVAGNTSSKTVTKAVTVTLAGAAVLRTTATSPFAVFSTQALPIKVIGPDPLLGSTRNLLA